MGLVPASSIARNQMAKWKEKRSEVKFNAMYNKLPTTDGDSAYLHGYLKIDPAYAGSNPDRVSYEKTDLYPNVDAGYNIKTLDRKFWSVDDLKNANLPIFLGNSDKFFRYSFAYGEEYDDNKFEDPTILGFEINIDAANSPLFDFNVLNDLPEATITNNSTPVVSDTYKAPNQVSFSGQLEFNTDDEDHQTVKPINGVKVPVDSKGNVIYNTVIADGKLLSASDELLGGGRYEKAVYNIIFPNNQVSNPESTPVTNATPKTSSSAPKADAPIGSASYWFNKYGNMDEISTKNRLKLLKEFQSLFLQIFNTDFPKKDQIRRPYYIQDVRGLDKLSEKIVDYKKDKLTITLTEDITLRTTYLAELYNNIYYSYQHQRYAIPENCMRFDMRIKITDKREFNLAKSQAELDQIGAGDGVANRPRDFFQIADNAYITYTLHDCTLDFFKSQPHGAEVTMGGYIAADFNQSQLQFDVYYKSISKEFKSDLIGSINNQKTGSFVIKNKEKDLYTDNLNYHSKVNDTFTKIERVDYVPKQVSKSQLGGTGIASRLKDKIFGDDNVNGNLISQVGDKVFDGVANAVDSVAGAILQKGRQIRGELIGKLTDSVTKGKFIAQVYPPSVYDANLDGMAGDGLGGNVGDQLANFGKNLIGNTIKSGLDGLNNLTSF